MRRDLCAWLRRSIGVRLTVRSSGRRSQGFPKSFSRPNTEFSVHQLTASGELRRTFATLEAACVDHQVGIALDSGS